MKNVLIVDDQAMIRKLVNMTLDDGRFSTSEACNGEEAIEMIKHKKPDLVILDIMMPGEVDGLGVCHIIKNTDGWQDIPVIFLTAKGQKLDVEEGLSTGADDYLIKPFSPEKLLQKVSDFI